MRSDMGNNPVEYRWRNERNSHGCLMRIDVRTDVSAILLVIHYHFDGNSVVEDDTWKPNRTFIDDHF